MGLNRNLASPAMQLAWYKTKSGSIFFFKEKPYYTFGLGLNIVYLC